MSLSNKETPSYLYFADAVNVLLLRILSFNLGIVLAWAGSTKAGNETKIGKHIQIITYLQSSKPIKLIMSIPAVWIESEQKPLK